MDRINCLRCGVPMKHYITEKIRLEPGRMFRLIYPMGSIVEYSLPVRIMICPQCKKLEFFLASGKKKKKSRTE